MKNIVEKLLGIGKAIKKGMGARLSEMAEDAMEIFTKIRLFTRGKGEKALEQKKKLGTELHRIASRMERRVRAEMGRMSQSSAAKYQEAMDLCRKMLKQIGQWIQTGFHPSGKILCLWLTDARSITRNKAAKATEFGRRWIITRLKQGYVIGTVCKRLGSDSDTGLMPEILDHFEQIMGCLPRKAVYDRGGDGPKNHKALKDKNTTNCIFRKGKESQPGLGRNTKLMARRERALSEATIATLKHPRYGFNKPRAKSSQGCILKGQAAILGANLAHLTRDWMAERA